MEHYATAQQVFAAGLVFARLGAIVMLIPGIGESFIPIRIRLSFALALALVLFPVIGAAVPPIPANVAGVALAVIKETAIGLLIGGILRIFMSSLAAAGEIISIQTTLSFAQTANPTQASPSTTIGTFLGLMEHRADHDHQPAPPLPVGDRAVLRDLPVHQGRAAG